MGLSTIRQAIVTACESVTGLRESPWLSDGPMRDPQTNLDGAFSVTAPRTEPADGRRHRVDGIRVRSTIVVRVLIVVRADGAFADYDAALDTEALVVAAVAGITTDCHGPPQLQRMDRAPVGDDTAVLLTSEWTVDHVVDVGTLPPGD